MNEFQVFGIIISVLLVVAFSQSNCTVILNVERDLAEVKTTTSLIKTEFKGINDLMNQKIEFLEKRLTHVETFIFKNMKDGN